MATVIPEQSVLVIVDVQQRLLTAMPEQSGSELVQQASVLITAADRLKIPMLVTEQYPKGLGSTDSRLQTLFSEQTITIEKTCFSCVQSEIFREQLSRLNRKQVILAGMESHICIMQTALALDEAGYDVYVVEDAVCSRRESHKRNAIDRLRQVGVTISNTESVLFEWLADAKHPEFRALSKLIL